MPYSMTGFADAERAAEPFQINWEIRSVNNRFLDLSFRLPDELRGLEARLREHAASRLSRGKVDCTLKLGFAGATAERRDLDPAVLAQLKEWRNEIESQWHDLQRPTTLDLLRWPGLLKEPKLEYDELTGPVRECFEAAIGTLVSARSREGERIGEFMTQRLDAIGALLQQIAPRLAGTADRHRDRLMERLERLDVQAQPERLEQEIALIAQRLDVTEETDRLTAHVAEVADVLTRDEPIGRRLDFLIQELNREANTLGSKVQDEDLTRAAVDLKVLIEQLREQVQNLE